MRIANFKKKSNLDVRIFENRRLMGNAAATAVADRIKVLMAEKKEVNIIFAAAPSQNEMLEALCKSDVEWGRINAFHMDEYIGLDQDAPQGFGNFLKLRLFDRFSFGSVHYLNGQTGRIEEECERYALLLKSFPPDIVCMGIGENGHLAFNDPPVANFNDDTLVKVVELDDICRQQQVNDGCFDTLDEVPLRALTLTIPALIAADHIYCVVPGPSKAKAVDNTLHKPVERRYPSTILRRHPHCILFLDEQSASLI